MNATSFNEFLKDIHPDAHKIPADKLRAIFAIAGARDIPPDFDPANPVIGAFGDRLVDLAKFLWKNRATIAALIRVALLFI